MPQDDGTRVLISTSGFGWFSPDPHLAAEARGFPIVTPAFPQSLSFKHITEDIRRVHPVAAIWDSMTCLALPRLRQNLSFYDNATASARRRPTPVRRVRYSTVLALLAADHRGTNDVVEHGGPLDPAKMSSFVECDDCRVWQSTREMSGIFVRHDAVCGPVHDHGRLVDVSWR
jgi:hypothetical protein